MAFSKKGIEKKKECSVIIKVMIREYNINSHKWICRAFKKQSLQEIHKLSLKEIETPDVYIDTRLNKAV
uniref:Uncharacterized protein n=1 Tax=Monodelphis domestica TaxID=13616 RepID=A0A5F8HFB4_MONDO